MTEPKQYTDALVVAIKNKFPLELFRHTLGFVHEAQIPYDLGDLFIAACTWGVYDIVEYFLSIGVDPNTRDKSHGSTAIMFAAQNKHKRVVELLLSHKVDLLALNNQGQSAEVYAKQCRSQDIIDLVIVGMQQQRDEQANLISKQQEDYDDLMKRYQIMQDLINRQQQEANATNDGGPLKRSRIDDLSMA